MSGQGRTARNDRPLVSVRGQARTRLARRAVVAAAGELFLELGYSATTIGAISARADVPPATLYRLFSSKLGVLKALLDTSIGGDDEEIAVPDRPEVSVLLTETDPAVLLERFAVVTTKINERSNDAYRVLVSAAGSDAAAAALLAEIQQQRDRGQGQLASALAGRAALRPGLSQSGAADVIHALMSPELYRLLVIDRRWKPQRYHRWLGTTLAQQLLDNEAEDRPPTT